ncbi:MAG: DUF1963 domain-containing protein [Flavobacterium sp.]
MTITSRNWAVTQDGCRENGTPEDKNGRKSELLFQIDSEDEAGLLWGDVGLVYVFYDSLDKSITFELQCH